MPVVFYSPPPMHGPTTALGGGNSYWYISYTPRLGLSQHPEISTLQTEVLPRSFKPARKLVEFISVLRGNMLRDILEVKPGKADEEDSKISLGIYLYLVFGENMLVENIPQVYSHLELLSVSIPYIRVLLENNQDIFVFKGVLLLKSLLKETHLC